MLDVALCSLNVRLMWSVLVSIARHASLGDRTVDARRVFRAALIAFALGVLTTGSAEAIVGTSEIDTDDGDRVVTLLTKGPEGAGFCSAVVLAPRVVLTAAHCVRSPQDVVVLTRTESGEPKLWPATAIARHPQYRTDAVASRRLSIDIALVLLASPLGNGNRPLPIAAESKFAVGDTVTLIGYGVTHAGDPTSGGTLHRARLTVRSPLSAVLLWADGGNDSTGACSGDSGSPLLNADGELIAIVAWADGGGRRGCGGVTQGPLLAPVRDWIDGVTRRWGY
jgi:V8-like Glu-specific endopeptidase